MWKPGDRLTHLYNPALGPGIVTAVEGRVVVVEFPASGETLRLAAASDALAPLELGPGSRARRISTGEAAIVEALTSETDAPSVRLRDGRTVPLDDLWPLDVGESPIERLAHGEIDPVEDFSNRLDALHLADIREADGLGSFLGGRIHLFPHQLHVAERATRTDPVRWLLADEVGLGKTVEACLILNRLLRTGRADRTLVVAPETLTVQWLGELWRKYHQVFVLLDERRLADVAKDFGEGFNPFDAHRRVVVGLEMLSGNPRLTEQAVEAGVDLLVADEAHHLRRPPGHPGDPAYRAVAPIAALGRHVLLLTATPLEDDAQGFFRLLQLLRPEEFPEGAPFEERLERSEPLPPCTSATRRADIGGLPPRVPAPVEPDETGDWTVLEQLEAATRSAQAKNPAQRRSKARRIRRALASGAALEPLLRPDESDLRTLAGKANKYDPRIRWIAGKARRWKEAGDKTLVFVAERETLEALRTAMERSAGFRLAVFHEDLSPQRRDIEVAQFRLPSGPSMLISTECGGEGRNFEFCTRLVLFDMPWSPAVVEQRIGRLDRIGRRIPVEVAYFRPPGGLGAAIVRLYEEIGLFREPLGGLDRELGHVEAAIESAALAKVDQQAQSGSVGTKEFEAAFENVIQEAREARTRVREAAYHELHREPYRPEMADSILARVPPDLDDLTSAFIWSSSGVRAPGRSSSATRRSWTVFRVCREGRASWGPSTGRGEWPTSRSTTSPPATRSSRGSWPSWMTAPVGGSLSCESAREGRNEPGCWPYIRKGRVSRRSPWTWTGASTRGGPTG
jgi:ATP-dependent helicase HepA